MLSYHCLYYTHFTVGRACLHATDVKARAVSQDQCKKENSPLLTLNGGGEDAMEEKIVKSSQVKSKRAGPKAAPLGRKQT